MERKGKMKAAIGAGAAFLISVGAIAWSTGMFETEQETTVEETTGLKAPKPVTQEELLGRSTFQLGESAEVNGLVWNISSAEIVDSYEKLDTYYKKRDNLYNPSELQILGDGGFVEEAKFVLIKYSIANHSEEDKVIYPGRLSFYDRFENSVFASIGSSGNDGRCTSLEMYIKDFQNEAVEIPAYAKMEFEYVLGYDSYWSPIYDLYVALNSASNVLVNTGSVVSEPKVCLGIAPKLRDVYHVDAAESAQEKRDIPAMKARQWSNLEMKSYQNKGYPQLSEKEGAEGYSTEAVVGMDYEFVDDITTKITSATVLNWSEMPEEYQTRGALENMAKRYDEKFGIAPESLKLLVLDVSYTAKDIEKDVIAYNKHICTFYDKSYLFTRDKEGKRWVFGTMDDWMVTSNSVNESRVGHINIEKMQVGDTIMVQAVYLLPPEIYENHDALYYCGGGLREWSGEADAPVAEILLK